MDSSTDHMETQQGILYYIRQNITSTIYFQVLFYVTLIGIIIHHFIYQYIRHKNHKIMQERTYKLRMEEYQRQKQKALELSRIKKRKQQQRSYIFNEDKQSLFRVNKNQENLINKAQNRSKFDNRKNKGKITIEDLKEKYKNQTKQKLIKYLNKKQQQKIKKQKQEQEQKNRQQKMKQEALKRQRKGVKFQQSNKSLGQNDKYDQKDDKNNFIRNAHKKSTIQTILQQSQQSQAGLSQRHSNFDTIRTDNKFQNQKDKHLQNFSLLTKYKTTNSQDKLINDKISETTTLFGKKTQDNFKMTSSIQGQNNKTGSLFNLTKVNMPTDNKNQENNKQVGLDISKGLFPSDNKTKIQLQGKDQKTLIDQSKSLFPANFSLPSVYTGPKIQQKPNQPVINQLASKKAQDSSMTNNKSKQQNKPDNKPIVPIKKQQIKKMKLTLSSLQYFQSIINYVSKQTVTAKIPTIFSNLGGPKSSLNDVLTFATSFISSLKKDDDKHLTSFAIQTYDSIIYLIKVANQRDGIYRIPPKQKSGQVQKNSINNYVLMINLYRLMGYQKIWMIFFGKLLKELQFLFKRQEEIKSYKDFQLIKNGHMQISGQLQGRILSRMDNLIYALLALTAFDPIGIFKYIEIKDPSIKKSRQQVQSWGRQWSYKQFWLLMDVILKKKNNFYFKPIIYINLLYVLYPRIYQNKSNKQKYVHEANLYMTIIDESKQFFSKLSTNNQIQQLKKNPTQTSSAFTYDGGTFYDGIKTLQARICVEKMKQYKTYTLDEFQKKCNTLYYFCKEK